MNKNKPIFTDPKALFLGAYSENHSEFKELIDFLIDDIAQWRRNYHPREKRVIKPSDKESQQWKSSFNNLKRELDIMLGDLKQSIPFHNPRFIGHMHSDLVIPSILGYLAGQLYNQNNVVGESSPVTTEKELRFIKYLCEMIHYPLFEYFNDGKESKIYSAGHLTSGGTTANIEALWTIRNIKYFPISVWLFVNTYNELEEWKEVCGTINDIVLGSVNREKKFNEYSVDELFNLPQSIIFDFFNRINTVVSTLLKGSINSESSIGIDDYSKSLKMLTVRHLGVHTLHQKVRELSGQGLELPTLLVPQSRHYSWEKAMDIIGIGASQIKYVKVNNSFKIDTDYFESICEKSKHVLAIVAVVGTTEEGVIDPIKDIVAVIDRQKSKGKGFAFHIDGAYGGYYSALFNDSKNEFLEKSDLSIYGKEIEEWISEELIEDMKCVKYSDSITIDPHKLGYIPYAVGAVLYKDNRSKIFTDNKPPYLSGIDQSDSFDSSKIYLGGSILEGSRSGASALACYLSSKVIQNNVEGYGLLIANTFKNAFAFIEKMERFNKSESVTNGEIEIDVVPLLNEPTNIVCYGVSTRNITLTPKIYNELNNRLYQAMSAAKNKMVQDYKFIISKTELNFKSDKLTPDYAEQITSFLNKFNINIDEESLEKSDFKLVLLRSTLMNPMLSESVRDEIFNDFFAYLKELIRKYLPEVLLDTLVQHNITERYNVLWVENEDKVEALKTNILFRNKSDMVDISRYLDIDFTGKIGEYDLNEYKIFIVDMNLDNNQHTEWFSGLNVLREIKKKVKNPIILIYSQFLSDDSIVADSGKIQKELLADYLIKYVGLDRNSLIPKTKSENYLTDQKVLNNDLKLIVNHLSKLIFEDLAKSGYLRS